MCDESFEAILQTLTNGQNPTPPSENNNGLTTVQHGETFGMKEVTFGLHSVNEGGEIDNSNTLSDK